MRPTKLQYNQLTTERSGGLRAIGNSCKEFAAVLRVFGPVSAAHTCGPAEADRRIPRIGQNAGSDECGRDRVDDPPQSLIEDIEGAASTSAVCRNGSSIQGDIRA